VESSVANFEASNGSPVESDAVSVEAESITDANGVPAESTAESIAESYGVPVESTLSIDPFPFTTASDYRAVLLHCIPQARRVLLISTGLFFH
jgi:hypothetical protein